MYCGMLWAMMQPLTIAFVTNNYTPYSGGVVSSICSFSTQLRALGHHVYIITLDFTGAPSEPDVIRVSCPIKFMYKHNPMAIPWCMHQELESIFARIRPDIVHTQHPFLLGDAAACVCKKMHIPVIFTFHTLYHHYVHYIPLPRVLVQSQVDRRVTQYCQSMDAIIAPSESVRAWLQAHQIITPTYVLASPLLPVFVQQLASFAYKTSHKIFNLVCVSRFVHEKNLFVLLDLMRAFHAQSVKLTLVGFGYLEQELRSYAYRTCGLTPERVIFVVRPSKQELCVLYRYADAFVFCSQTETQGLVLLEAMAAGTPIVALVGSGQNDLVRDGVNGFLAHTPEHLRAIICTLMGNRELHKKLQYGAWATAHLYTPEILTQRLLACYQNFL